MINLRPRPQHWRSALLTGGVKTNPWRGGYHIKIQIFNSTFYLLRLKYNFQHNEYGFFQKPSSWYIQNDPQWICKKQFNNMYLAVLSYCDLYKGILSSIRCTVLLFVRYHVIPKSPFSNIRKWFSNIRY